MLIEDEDNYSALTSERAREQSERASYYLWRKGVRYGDSPVTYRPSKEILIKYNDPQYQQELEIRRAMEQRERDRLLEAYRASQVSRTPIRRNQYTDKLETDLKTPKMIADEMVRMIAEKHEVPVAAIYSSRRDGKIIKARIECYIALRKAPELVTWSITKIARYFNKDHTTLVYALKKYGKEEAFAP